MKQIISNFDSKLLCIWANNKYSDQNMDSLKFLLEIKSVTYINVDYNTVNIFAKSCMINILLSLDLHKITKFYKDRPPMVNNLFLITLTEKTSYKDFGEDDIRKFGAARTILFERNRIFKLSSPYFPPRRFQSASLTSAVEKETVLNLRQRRVNVATFNCSLFSIIQSPLDSKPHDGIEIRILNELAYSLNFTPVLMNGLGVGKWGLMLPNGSWVGGISGALEIGDAELGFCNIWNALRYVNSFDFGPQWNVVCFIG